MQGKESKFNRKTSIRGSIVFAAGILFLFLAGIFGYSEPTQSIILGALAAISLTTGMYYLSHAPKNEETPVHLKYYQDPGVGRHLPKSEGAAGTCRTKNRATLGAVLFAFGTFLLLLSPIWGVEHFERIILTVITGGLILAYGLFRIVT